MSAHLNSSHTKQHHHRPDVPALCLHYAANNNVVIDLQRITYVGSAAHSVVFLAIAQHQTGASSGAVEDQTQR